jgi:hypothetical protein
MRSCGGPTSVEEDEVGECEVHQWTTGGIWGGGRLNIGKEVVDAFLEGTATCDWEGVDKGDVPGELVPRDWQESHPDSDSLSSEGAALEFEASSVKVGVPPKGL